MKILCPKCKGRKTVIDVFDAVFTIGFSLIVKYDKDDGRKLCPTCDGRGCLDLK